MLGTPAFGLGAGGGNGLPPSPADLAGLIGGLLRTTVAALTPGPDDGGAAVDAGRESQLCLSLSVALGGLLGRAAPASQALRRLLAGLDCRLCASLLGPGKRGSGYEVSLRGSPQRVR
jgi:hypothetical protein